MSEGLEDAGWLVRQYRPRLTRYFALALRDQDAADTLTQDCLLKAHRARESFRGESSLDTWMFAIAGNLMRDHLRNSKLRFWRRAEAQAVDLGEFAEVHASSEATPEQALLARERTSRVMRALDNVSMNQRRVFLLRFVEEMDNSSIAEATGMSVETVKTHLRRALAAIQQQMEASR